MPNWKPCWLITAVQHSTGKTVAFLVKLDQRTEYWGKLPAEVTLMSSDENILFTWNEHKCQITACDGTSATAAEGDILIWIRRILYDLPLLSPPPPPPPAPLVYNPDI